MATPTRDVKISGSYRTIKDVWVKVGGAWHQVVGIYVKKSGVYKNVMDFMPGRPGGLTVTQQDYSSVTLHWNAPTTGQSVEAYEILRRPANASLADTPTVVKRLVPADGTFFSTRTWKVSGLAGNTTYVFSVRAVNTTPGVDVRGDETSPARTVYTGVSEKRETGSSVHKVQADKDKPLETVTYYVFQPTKIDTYSQAKLWSTPGAQGRPGQGVYDVTSEQNNRRMYGCIDYSGIYNSFVSRHGKVDVNGVERAIADFINITKCTIRTIGRPKGTGGGSTPTLSLHNGYFLIGTNVTPTVDMTENGSFTHAAPKLGEKTGEISNGELRNWANNWTAPPASRHRSGIVLFRSDGEHYCVLAGINETGTEFDGSWDLKLEYEWDFVTRTAKAHTNSSYTWPT